MEMVKKVRATLLKPERKIITLMPELKKLREEIDAAYTVRPLDGIVQFISSTSRWQDRNIGKIIRRFEKANTGQYDGLLTEIRIIHKHVNAAGRDIFGMNRTRKGEEVTDDDVFLSIAYGMYRNPVSYWKKAKNKEKGGSWSAITEGPREYKMVSWEAHAFLKENAIPLLSALQNIIECAEQLQVSVK